MTRFVIFRRTCGEQGAAGRCANDPPIVQSLLERIKNARVSSVRGNKALCTLVGHPAEDGFAEGSVRSRILEPTIRDNSYD